MAARLNLGISIGVMGMDEKLERLTAKYFLYLHFRDQKAVKWVHERHHGIAVGTRFSENEIEKFIEEGNFDAAKKAFEELMRQDNFTAKLCRDGG